MESVAEEEDDAGRDEDRANTFFREDSVVTSFGLTTKEKACVVAAAEARKMAAV